MKRRRRIQPGLPVLAIAAMLACRTPHAAPKQPRRASCPEASADTAGWQPVAYGPFTTILPAAFRPDSVMRCFHGGEFWADGPRTFGYCGGSMEPIVPTGARWERVLPVAGRPAVLSCVWYRGQWTLMAYHVGDGTEFGIHGESPDRAGLAVFVRALESARPRVP
jgi:hypothetical protein